jgi:hypothetical protein
MPNEKTRQFVVEQDGRTVGLKDDIADKVLGGLKTDVFRVSHIREIDGKFVPDMSPVGGPCLDPCATRAEAIEAEIAYIHANFAQIAAETLRRHDAGLVSV